MSRFFVWMIFKNRRELMRKSINKVLKHGVLGLGIICLEGQAMGADVDLMERGTAGINTHPLTVSKRDFARDNYVLNERWVEAKANHFSGCVQLPSLGIAVDFYDDTPFSMRVCITSACSVGGLVILHIFGVI